MKIYKVTELSETKGGQTYVSTKVFSTKMGGWRYFTKRRKEISEELTEGGDKEYLEKYEYESCVVLCYDDDYVTLYKAVEDDLN